MAAINPRIPLTEVTAEQYAALAIKDPHRLYAVPYSGDATASSAGDLQTVLTIRYLLDAIMTDDDTLYCVAQLEPIETISQDLLTAENGDLLCVRSTAGAVYTTSLDGICASDTGGIRCDYRKIGIYEIHCTGWCGDTGVPRHGSDEVR